MMWTYRVGTTAVLAATLVVFVAAESPPPPAAGDDPARQLVGRLNLEAYKATIKELTKFGDRRQGTVRNHAANDWIAAQLKRYGCTHIERLKYEYQPQPRSGAPGGANAGDGAKDASRPTDDDDSGRRNAASKGATGPAGSGPDRSVPGDGSSAKGFHHFTTGANRDPNKQSDVSLRQLNTQPPTPGPREEVYCTKIGTLHPDQMYIVSGHMDGVGYGEAANDDASGTAIVMELARILSAPGVQTETSIRFILWNNEETAMAGSRAYVEQRRALQGKEEPPGSGQYPEPKWLGIIQHDMMLFDHGMPHADGSISVEQRLEADINVEFASGSKLAAESQKLAWLLKTANDRYATDYPVAIGDGMFNTDSVPFQDFAPAISVRDLDRITQIAAGWDPHKHQATDLFATYSDKDFRLGLNAAQTTLAALARLGGAKVK